MHGLGGLLIAVSLVALVISATRSRALCVLSVRRGKLLIMRGSLPAAVLESLSDIAWRGRVERGTIRVLRDGERARLEGSGLDAHTLQRARNVLGTFPLARLLAAPRPRARNLGQWLGLPWLGWRLHERRQGSGTSP